MYESRTNLPCAGRIWWIDAPGLKNLFPGDLPAWFKARFKATCTGTNGESISVEWYMVMFLRRYGEDFLGEPEFSETMDNLPVQSR